MQKLSVLFVLVVFAIVACATAKEHKKTSTGAVAGAVVGAGVGYAVSKDAKGAAIGAAVGALAGGGIGYMMDKQEQEFRRELAESESTSIKREEETIILDFKSDATFDSGSAELKPEAISEMDRVAEIINRYPNTNIRVEGHTDSVGSEEFNLKLSEQRAQAVKDALVSRNVAASRIQVIGFGESQPIADNNTESGRLQNRRVSIIIVPTEG